MNDDLPPIYVGQNVTLSFTVYDEDGNTIDPSTSTSTILTLKRINGITKTFTILSVVNGHAEYLAVPVDFDIAGTWKIQLVLTLQSREYPSSTVILTVKPRA